MTAGRWRVEVDTAVCVGSGMCAGHAPHVFALDPTRRSHPLTPPHRPRPRRPDRRRTLPGGSDPAHPGGDGRAGFPSGGVAGAAPPGAVAAVPWGGAAPPVGPPACRGRRRAVLWWLGTSCCGPPPASGGSAPPVGPPACRGRRRTGRLRCGAGCGEAARGGGGRAVVRPERVGVRAVDGPGGPGL
ncbi:hypothetical protein SCATT_14200 [Streptantibioticus cattleyicolor NRRL 8057 = DSM 46488]|uniref:4Fe-4S ferredoxin-type domain-containing protein n=1 Tax=Streptantibioticus cattleyicolor (strain ATCC 35852 / DSM 46488 / JCM 4925 / NBRC 14057 / NRRL 8057) TaxID=1003195 RepID=G8WZ41_STREN|nr:hypothetical protein SCATT_14200 [Streptantibioticus cattleyicolor NRRL 8057 = DSM 46488]